jgi:hypothetical protein
VIYTAQFKLIVSGIRPLGTHVNPIPSGSSVVRPNQNFAPNSTSQIRLPGHAQTSNSNFSPTSNNIRPPSTNMTSNSNIRPCSSNLSSNPSSIRPPSQAVSASPQSTPSSRPAVPMPFSGRVRDVLYI